MEELTSVLILFNGVYIMIFSWYGKVRCGIIKTKFSTKLETYIEKNYVSTNTAKY